MSTLSTRIYTLSLYIETDGFGWLCAVLFGVMCFLFGAAFEAHAVGGAL